MHRAYIKMIAIFAIINIYSSQAIATATCTTTGTPGDQTVNINGSFYAGEELPIGTVLYQADLDASGPGGPGMSLTCSESYDDLGTSLYAHAITEPSGLPSAVSGSPISGKIYPTNVPGVGVAVTMGNMGTESITSSPMFAGTVHNDTRHMYHRVWLIKTGNIPSGSSISGTSFPTIQVYYTANQSVIGLPAIFGTLRFSGTMNVTTKTCQTPSYNVDMGTYKSSEFSGIGSTTPWVDASIKLTNCPQFLGYHYNQSIVGSGTPSGDTYTANLFKVELRPMTTTSDDGYINVGTEQGDGIISPGSATGVKLQLGYSTHLNGDATSSPSLWNPSSKWSIELPKHILNYVNIPLSARYKQTEDRVKPGNADAKVVFTISYY